MNTERAAPDPSALPQLIEWSEWLTAIANNVTDLHAELVTLRRESEAVVVLLDERGIELTEKQTQLARLERESARAGQERAEALASLDERTRVLEAAGERVASLERVLGEREAELAEHETSLRRLAEESARAREGRDETQAPLHVAQRALETTREHVRVLEHECEVLRTRVGELQKPESPASGAVVDPSSHLCFIPQPSSYALVEAGGPPPPVGSSVELSGDRFSVVKVGNSPLPGESRPCAFLLPEPTVDTSQSP
jgi:hypothetical protein